MKSAVSDPKHSVVSIATGVTGVSSFRNKFFNTYTYIYLLRLIAFY